MYIGPQYDDAGLGRTRSQLVWFNDDPCDAGAIARQASLMNGRAVLLGNPNGVCSPSLMYDMFRATNATVVATIDASPVPTYGGILMDDVYGRRRHPGGMLFVRFHLDSDMANVLTRTVSDSNAASVVIEVTPDYNVWLDVIASWWYIVFVQVLPAIYYGTCSVLAVFYLYRHICFAISEPDHATPVTMRNRSRSLCGPLGRVVLRWSIPQTALLVESAATMVLCVNSASDFGAALNFDYLALCVLQSQLSGVSCSCTLLSAIFWGRCRDKLFACGKPPSPLERFAGRHQRLLSTMMWTLVALPAVADTVLGIVIGYRIAAQFFLEAYTLILMVVYAIIAVYFFQQARLFRKDASRVVGGVDPDMLAFVARISRWTTRCALCMIFTICILPIGATIWLWEPTGWTVFWTLTSVSRSGISLCHIQEFRPRDRGKRASRSPMVAPR
ncbi:unnamed protein product (mitochondrion) [Plasmodiophora brassicae]|uniref:Uncharacterized protein n=1 Tax=Plasmodiophora brassicae TaxID=37360 RepID=A0A3P3Y6G1_PLABS|nr:unnamed protein product [Plasmodiophora brassicae]